jgi:hypothetical protein
MITPQVGSLAIMVQPKVLGGVHTALPPVAHWLKWAQPPEVAQLQVPGS